MKGHVIEECPLKAPSRGKTPALEPKGKPNNPSSSISKESKLKEVYANSAKDSSGNPSNPSNHTRSDTETRKGRNECFLLLPKRNTFKHKKFNLSKAKADFYFLLNKPDISDEDEEVMETIPRTQLNLNCMASELVELDYSPIHEEGDSNHERATEHQHRSIAISDNVMDISIDLKISWASGGFS